MDNDRVRIHYAGALGIAGVVVPVILAVVLIFEEGWGATVVASVVGLFTSLIGPLVGAFLGYEAGSAGKEKEQKARINSERRLDIVRGQLDDATMARVRDLWNQANLYP